MAVTREELRTIIARLKGVYTQKDFIPDQFAFDTWCLLLQEFEKEQLEAAALQIMRTNIYPPKPADITTLISKTKNLMNDSELNELSAWALVRKALSNSNYNSEEEFNKLPQILKKCIREPKTLKEWALADGKQLTVIQSNFMRTFTSELNKQEQLEKIPLKIRELIRGNNDGTRSNIESK